MPPLISPGWRCSPTSAPPRLVEVLRDAVACIGMHESPPGSNRGPQVDVWLRLAHAEPGDPWCASWLTACYQRTDPPPIPAYPLDARLEELQACDLATFAPAWATVRGALAAWLTAGPFAP